MKFTHDIPTRPGYYYWTNFGEHTPTVLFVERSGGKLYASGGEFSFPVKKVKLSKEDKDPELMVDGHYYGEEMWCPIEMPTMDGKVIEPDCY